METADDAVRHMASIIANVRIIQDRDTWFAAADLIRPIHESGDCGQMLLGVLEEMERRAGVRR